MKSEEKIKTMLETVNKLIELKEYEKYGKSEVEIKADKRLLEYILN